MQPLISSRAQSSMQLSACPAQTGFGSGSSELWVAPWRKQRPCVWDRRLTRPKRDQVGVAGIHHLLVHRVPQSLLLEAMAWTPCLSSGMIRQSSGIVFVTTTICSWSSTILLVRKNRAVSSRQTMTMWNSMHQFSSRCCKSWEIMTCSSLALRTWMLPLMHSTSCQRLADAVTWFIKKHGQSVEWLVVWRSSSTELLPLRTIDSPKYIYICMHIVKMNYIWYTTLIGFWSKAYPAHADHPNVLPETSGMQDAVVQDLVQALGFSTGEVWWGGRVVELYKKNCHYYPKFSCHGIPLHEKLCIPRHIGLP